MARISGPFDDEVLRRVWDVLLVDGIEVGASRALKAVAGRVPSLLGAIQLASECHPVPREGGP